jgi:hypothetical protein
MEVEVRRSEVELRKGMMCKIHVVDRRGKETISPGFHDSNVNG